MKSQRKQLEADLRKQVSLNFSEYKCQFLRTASKLKKIKENAYSFVHIVHKTSHRTMNIKEVRCVNKTVVLLIKPIVC